MRELKLLERHFRHWRAEGLVSAELESAIRESSGRLVHKSTGTVVRTALVGLGGGLLLAGLILIIAENWEGLPRSLKLGAGSSSSSASWQRLIDSAGAGRIGRRWRRP